MCNRESWEYIEISLTNQSVEESNNQTMYNVQSRRIFTSRSSLAAFSISDALQMWNQTSSSVEDVILNGDEFNTKHFHIIQIQNIEKRVKANLAAGTGAWGCCWKVWLFVNLPNPSWPFGSSPESQNIYLSHFCFQILSKKPSNPFEPVF